MHARLYPVLFVFLIFWFFSNKQEHLHDLLDLYYCFKMYGIMPLEEYVANYDAILENKPFKFGNMKGKKLNKAKFFNDHSDYEVLLRKEIPEKYAKYFINENRKPSAQKDSDIMGVNNYHDDFEIEYPRSNNMNLSPIKSHTEKGVKDSEVLLGKSGKQIFSDNLNFFKNDNEDDTEKLMKSEYTLNLGDLNNHNDPFNEDMIQKKVPKYQKVEFNSELDKDLDISSLQIDDLDDLFEKTFKKLNKNSLNNKDGKELNSVIMKLVENLKDYKSENSKLKNDVNDMNLIIKDLNKLASVYKTKLKAYYLENRSLKSQLQNTHQPEFESSNSSAKIESVESIDSEIEALQMRKKLLTQKSNPQINISSLSDEIVKKLMNQLIQHNNGNHKSDEKHNQHQDCPFCETKPSKDSFIRDLFSDKSFKSQEQIIDLLAERLKSKLSQDGQTNLPEIW